MQFNEVNICQVMIFRLYTVYTKYEVIKIGNHNREKPQILFIASARTVLVLIVNEKNLLITHSVLQDLYFY